MARNISYKYRNGFFSKIKIIKVIICGILLLAVIILFPHFFRYTYIVTIANKRVIKHQNTDTYLIYTQMKDGNIKTFKDTNSLLELKINSENVYYSFTINGKYEITAYGLNIPLLSSYQNIIKAKGVK